MVIAHVTLKAQCPMGEWEAKGVQRRDVDHKKKAKMTFLGPWNPILDF